MPPTVHIESFPTSLEKYPFSAIVRSLPLVSVFLNLVVLHFPTARRRSEGNMGMRLEDLAVVSPEI